MTDHLPEFLAKPTDQPAGPRQRYTNVSRQIDVSDTHIEAEVRGAAGTVNEGTGLDYLVEEGLNPSEWKATHFRKIKYGKDMESVKFSYVRIGVETNLPDLDELIKKAMRIRSGQGRGGQHGFVIGLGDTQFGKIDGDGVEGALSRCIEYLAEAKNLLAIHRKRFDIGHVHLAFLGDHIEGFESQGGANTWRTPLTLNEQIRLTRRVMYHAAYLFAPTAARVTLAAVPGNHGRVGVSGKGTTRYDDSHDTESLVAVADAVKLNPRAFGHVEFYVPRTDEIAVTLDVANTRIAHAHGDRWTKGKHFDWWKGQAFGHHAMADADILMAGHYHFGMVEEDGDHTYVQAPALESESTWYRHKKGAPGNPGIFTGVVKDHRLLAQEFIR